METLKRWFQIGLSDGKKKEGRALSPEVNLKKLMAYGGPLQAGTVQLGFSLPVEASEQAREAARAYVEKMGFADVHVASMEAMGMGFSHFLVFARSKQSVDFTKMKASLQGHPKRGFSEINHIARERFGRRLGVLGVDLSGSGSSEKIDRILTVKGYKSEYGLERYPCFKVSNLHAQASLEPLRRRLGELKPDAILVGQAASWKAASSAGLKELMGAIEAPKGAEAPLKILIGPTLTPAQLKKTGFDACFSEESLPSEIAGFIVQRWIERAG